MHRIFSVLIALLLLSSVLFGQSITITSPNGGESWAAGQPRDIKWTWSGGFANVKIEISTNNGASWTVLVSSTTNDGSKGVTAPSTNSDQCLIRVSNANGGAPSDISNSTFTIIGTTTPPPAVRDSVWVISPNGGEKLETSTSANLTFGKQGTIGSIRIELSTDNGASWQFVGITPNNNFIWTVPAFISPVCLLRIADQNDGIPSDLSDRVFSIIEPVKRSNLIVTWNPNTEEDLAGYWVYVGTSSRSYPTANFTTDTTFVIENLLPATYFIAVTAIDNAGNESGYSQEVSAVIETNPSDVTPPAIPTGVNTKIE